MYSNSIVRHLLDDIENYKRQNYDAELMVNIYLSGDTSFYFSICDVFRIVDSEFLSIDEFKDGIPLKTLLRCDSIIGYDFSITEDTPD